MSTDRFSQSSTTSDQAFLGQLAACLEQNRFDRLVLSKYVGEDATLVRVVVRQVVIKGQAQLTFCYSHKTRDITKNLPIADGLVCIAELLGTSFRSANLFAVDEALQLNFSKRGKPMLSRSSHIPPVDASREHNREKQRYLDLDRDFLTALGVTNAQHQLIPSMSRKWKQINKFVELFQRAFDSSALKDKAVVDVLDFGSGKGYLTFAIHDFLTRGRHIKGQVTGVELRADMVQFCSAVADRLKLDGLHFHLGDVRSYAPKAIDVMIALHACDVATDYAIHMGIRSNAAIIMCAPCCHKEIRPQIINPTVLNPLLQYGVHLGQEAEMVTDTLRAMLLEACGYNTQVLEFISLEHTSKNKMILAVKRGHPRPSDEVLAQIKVLKAFYGIQEQCLEKLLGEAGESWAARSDAG